MLKSRLMPCIIAKGHLVVQSYGFERYLPIGDIKTAIEFFVNWDVDEIVVLDIDASREGRSPDIELVKWATRECFVPLTVGGGIRSIEHIHALLKAGADKVCINGLAADQPEFITEASRIFGSQCITVSIDAKESDHGHRVWDYRTKSLSEDSMLERCLRCEELGAGEIFLNSVDRDGSRLGYDLDLLRSITSELSIPVIACGGVGKVSHLSEGLLQGGAQAAAAANIFQHTEHSTIAAKSHMLASGVDVRLSSDVRYSDFAFDRMGRPL